MILPVKMEVCSSPIIVIVDPEHGRIQIARQWYAFCVSVGVRRAIVKRESLAIAAATEMRTATIPVFDKAEIVVALEENDPL